MPNPLPQLMPRDLLEMENLLRRNLAGFFTFSGHALYFPTDPAQHSLKLLPGERRLLLPLAVEGRMLGVFMARGVRPREIRPLLPVLPAMAALCLNNLALAKAACTDALTSFATEDALFAHIEQCAARVRNFLEDPAAIGNVPLHSLCFGLVLVRLCNGEDIARQVGYVFENDFLRELAKACAGDPPQCLLPSNVLPARVGRYDFALLLPAAGRAVCDDTARGALARMQAVRLSHPLFSRPLSPILCAGHAVYPQDMRGADMVNPMYDQARRLLSRASLAADVARSMATGSNRTLAFARILHEGGVVRDVQGRDILGGACVCVNLGRKVGAVEGMRFAVCNRRSGAYKGEIMLLQIYAMDSMAEIMHVADAANPPASGDALTLLATGSDFVGERGTGAAVSFMNVDGIFGYGDFLKRSVGEAGKLVRFTIAIVRFEKAGPRVFADALRLLRKLARQESAETDAKEPFAFCGEYGDTGLIFFHSDSTPEALLPLYRALCAALGNRGPAAGLAGYPFLHFSKAEIRDCALKALDYALLLPEPKAGVCNSLALNIGADRLYSQGDLFTAMEEYKLAILADKNNIMALNSLGVCVAALGRKEEARRYFLTALKRGSGSGDPLEAQTCYNLGSVCQSLNKRRSAAHYYRRCIACAPDHIFAHIRLGQLSEASGKTSQARSLYEHAIELEDAGRQTSPARRMLAGFMARKRRHGEARELLREALMHNPDDAQAMLDMAKLYLNGNESPELAEMFARRSLGILDRPETRQTLARALRALKCDEGRLLEADPITEAHF
ncbi:MAG: tetratricopeptide repeat protein [Desulfovibrio sp.]|nr:tetratricopeptide repeat protein [Desulfovibrio sp.]